MKFFAMSCICHVKVLDFALTKATIGRSVDNSLTRDCCHV